jgi:hypothetical protein
VFTVQHRQVGAADARVADAVENGHLRDEHRRGGDRAESEQVTPVCLRSSLRAVSVLSERLSKTVKVTLTEKLG